MGSRSQVASSTQLSAHYTRATSWLEALAVATLALEHVYAYINATMTLLNPCQRRILACSLVPLVNLIRANQANADISVGFSQPSPLMTPPLTAAETTMVAETTTVATAANKGTPPHPE